MPDVRDSLTAAKVGFQVLGLLVALALLASPARSQQEPDHGKVVFSSAAPPTQTEPGDVLPKDPVTNEERAAVVIVSDDLDLHLTPAEAREEAHALLTLRNTSSIPLKRIPLQITSTLRWQSISSGGRPVPFTQNPITTDADHTGYAQEAVLNLAPDHALAPGRSLTVSVFFSGQITTSTSRLELIGTPPERAAETDWDAIAQTSDESSTALRGFGEVLWYPCASPTALLGEGNQLFQVVGRQRQLNAAASMRLRLTIVYAGDPPDAVVFNSSVQSLLRSPDNDDQVVDETHGLATADFPFAPIGFRTPNLFITAQHPTQTASPLLSVISPVPEAADPYTVAVESLQPLFTDWIAPAPINPLLLLEHPGAPFEDGPFVAAHLSASAQPESIAVELVRPITHAFFGDPAPSSLWLDQGLPEFMSLLWTERSQGRAAAVDQLQQHALTIALAEPDLATDPALTGTPLSKASSDVLLRFKSAAVLWQLRDLLGDDTMRRVLTTFRHSLSLNASLQSDQSAFQKSLEKTAGLDLAWFFSDWVYNDRSLPDLTIVSVTPRPILPKTGRAGGYLVVVDVRNDGYAAASVPVTVRSGSLTATERLRIPGRATASTHIVFEGSPDTIQVNDGSVPELRTSTHTTQVGLANPN